MNTKRGGLILLLFLCFCHVVGILFFCKGFLLKRVVIPEYSKCTRGQSEGVAPSCSGYPRRYRRVLWLLIDALRYDFVAHDESLDPVPMYRNKMPYVRDLLTDSPANAKLFRFVADPPTTTMQRLKALTTGGLPTFIDIGNNFNSYEILEDSLIYQSHSNNRTVTFMGDDTWLGLYPSMLTKVFDFPSLNVKDIHTVDNGVIEHLFPELRQRDADMIVGHFLGVDHIGHTYGPSHWTMGDKLAQMDKVLKTVMESVDNDTIVVVLGDHGMTSTGDHGGETQLETDAALLVYSPLPLFDPLQPSGRSVYQIDLVPTVSLLLGVPIPFSNLGMLIPELFLPFTDSSSSAHHDNGFSGRVTDDLLTALRINANQIHKYLSTYVQYSGDIPEQTYHGLAQRIDHILTVHNSHGVRAQTDLTDLANAYVSYMKDVKDMCHRVWAKFDDVPIWYGLLLTILSVLLTPVMLLNVDEAVSSLRGSLHYAALIGLVVAGVVSSSALSVLLIVSNFLYWTLSITTLAILWNMRRTLYISMTSSLHHSFRLISPLTVTIVVLYATSLLSNSYVLYEGDMIAFFLQTLTVCFTVRRLQLDLATTQGLLMTVVRSLSPCVALMVCVRVSKVFYVCRDLQYQDGCQELTFVSGLLTAGDVLGWLGKWRLLLSCVSVVATPVLISRVIGGNTMSRYLDKWPVTLLRVGLPLTGVCVSGYWALQLLPASTLNDLSYWEHVTLPWIVYAISAITIATVVWRPLTVPSTELTMTDDTNTSPPEQRRPPVKAPTEPRTNAPTALHKLIGVEYIVGMIVIVLLTSVWIPLSLLLNDGLALSAALTVLQVALAVHILSGAETGSSLQVCVFWGLLTCHTFFAFGHSATVTSLRFECAFTGIHGEINSFNLPLAGALVGLNTLGPQIMFGLGLPLLLLLDKSSKGCLSDRLLRIALTVVSFHSVKLVVSMFAASLHRRHLMVWWVFTPRFLYEAAFQVTTDVTIILVYILVQRLEGIIRNNTELNTHSK